MTASASAWIVCGSHVGNVEAAIPPLNLEVFRLGFPRAFVFRQAEVLANLRSFYDWEQPFLLLSGIEGKLLQESRTDTVTERNLDYFQRFKRRHPEKMVLLHLNGKAQLPEYETSWYAGFWLYRAGTSLSFDLDPATDEFQVADASVFNLEADGFGGMWEDLVITGRNGNGSPDFSVAEQVRLVEIGEANTVRVLRGAYGSTARDWLAGAYIAAHVSDGPWLRGDPKQWLYNLAANGPRDANGRSVIDAIGDGLAPKFADGGPLSTIDGIELDTFRLGARERFKVDGDGDGVADNAFAGGVDQYVLGQIAFTARLRKILGPGRLLLTDGALGQTPDAASVNGVETEGFPSGHDLNMLQWSQGLETVDFWKRKGLSPRLSYIMYKRKYPDNYPVSFPHFRMALAASLFTRAAFTYFDEPGGSSTQGLLPTEENSGIFPNVFTIWDELLGGDLQQQGWLGMPMGPTVHMAETRPDLDLYGGDGVAFPEPFVQQFNGQDVEFDRIDRAGDIRLFVHSTVAVANLTFDLPVISLPETEIVLALDVKAPKRAAFPEKVPRLLDFTLRTPGSVESQTITMTVNPSWLHIVVAVRRLTAGPMQVTLKIQGGEPMHLRALRAFAAGDAVYREFDNGAVFANASEFPYNFDLDVIFPGVTFRRLTGSLKQDQATNNGKIIGPMLTLPPVDALLVRKISAHAAN